MTWFKVDDRFHSHPKVLALREGKYEETALSLWLKAGSWCASNLTDGLVPAYAVNTLVRRNGARAAAELVRVRLWDECSGGYRFLAWDEYQPSRAQIESKRDKNSKKVATWRERNQACNQVTDEHVTGLVTGLVTLPPTRPDPTQERERESPPAVSSEPVGRFLASFDPPKPDPLRAVATRFSDARKAAGAGSWHWDGKTYGKTAEALERVAGCLSDEIDQDAYFARAMRGFLADTKAKEAGFPIGYLAHDFGAYAAKGAKVAPTPTANPERESRAIELATESNRLLKAAQVALQRGDKAEHSRLTRESQRIARMHRSLHQEAT